MLRHLTRLGRNLCSATYHTKYARIAAFSNDISANWPSGIKSVLEREGVREPTSIQAKTLPLALENKDVVGIARTGSGKTLAFAIPAVIKVLQEREANGTDSYEERSPTCLVLAPTRELATQIYEVMVKFKVTGVNSIPLVGGSSRSRQIQDLSSRKQDIYIATPGRLMDLLDSSLIDLSKIKYLVLDEADRMLDMGFEPQIRRIVEKLPDKRQTLMWSATWPEEIQSLAQVFLSNYKYVAVDSEKLKANPNIKQIIEVCPPNDKLRILLQHLKSFKEDCEQPRILVFVNTKRMADMLLIQLMRHKHKAIVTHGDKSQNQRDQALRLFKQQLCHILVATDVAARGLDISDITHVINYDFPNSIEDYIHRIGRTARHDRKGIAITLLTENNANSASKLIRVLRETNQEVPAELQELSMNQHNYTNEKPTRRRRFSGNDFYSGGRGRITQYRPSTSDLFEDDEDQPRRPNRDRRSSY